jgi:Na+/H+ antiporter NhaD/arsenite permease-like protein
MIVTLILIVFVAGYLAIAFENVLKVNKAASALITAVLCWTIYMFSSDDVQHVSDNLIHSFGEIASILFFLLGAMTIVEIIDSHNGFDIITRRINSSSKSRLLFIIAAITFFLSAILDNLTTAIVMVSLCRKLLSEKEDRLWFSGIIIIASNLGGAWSPLGDVTTTMLWIGGQITPLKIIGSLLLPCLLACILPVIIVSKKFKGKYFESLPVAELSAPEKRKGRIILFVGIGFLFFVPLFKTITHLPPFMGMLLALGLMWIITTIIHKDKQDEYKEQFTVARALQRIDTPSILFFLGILLAVAALQTMGILTTTAHVLSSSFKNDYIIGTVLGLLSAVVDNVPLVAATQGMYDLSVYPTDHAFWEFLALTTGSGGSIIIIGSAAGVAVMGIEQVTFSWYLKKIGWIALLAFVVGIATFLLQHVWLGR